LFAVLWVLGFDSMKINANNRSKNHTTVLAEWGSLTRLMRLGINLKGTSGAAQRAASTMSLVLELQYYY
jgi:hypothetical protein